MNQSFNVPEFFWLTHDFYENDNNKLVTEEESKYPGNAKVFGMSKYRSRYKGKKDEVLKNVKTLSLNLKFWDDFFAGNEILILDNFFCKENLFMLLTLMHERILNMHINQEGPKKRITILSERLLRNDMRTILNNSPYSILNRYYDFESFKTLNNFSSHDRFVFINDYFWHFGVSVGGMYTGFQLNAYSGPWQDNGNCSKAIYDKLYPKTNKQFSI